MAFGSISQLSHRAFCQSGPGPQISGFQRALQTSLWCMSRLALALGESYRILTVWQCANLSNCLNIRSLAGRKGLSSRLEANSGPDAQHASKRASRPVFPHRYPVLERSYLAFDRQDANLYPRLQLEPWVNRPQATSYVAVHQGDFGEIPVFN